MEERAAQSVIIDNKRKADRRIQEAKDKARPGKSVIVVVSLGVI